MRSGTSTLKPTCQNWKTGDIHIKSIGKNYGTDFDIRELLEAVRKWEESEMTGAKVRHEMFALEYEGSIKRKNIYEQSIKHRLSVPLLKRRSWLLYMMVDQLSFSICRCLISTFVGFQNQNTTGFRRPLKHITL